MPSGYLAGRPQSVAIGTTSMKVASSNPGRVTYAICNTGANPVSIGLGADVPFGGGIYLITNGTYQIDVHNPFDGEIWMISTGAGTNVAIQEVSRG